MLGLRHDDLDPCFDIPAVFPSWPAILSQKKNKTSRTLTGIEPGPIFFKLVCLPQNVHWCHSSVNCRAICHQFSPKSQVVQLLAVANRCYLAPPQPRCDHRLARWGWSGAARRCRSPPNTAPTAGWPTSTRSSLRRFLGQNSLKIVRVLAYIYLYDRIWSYVYHMCTKNTQTSRHTPAPRTAKSRPTTATVSPGMKRRVTPSKAGGKDGRYLQFWLGTSRMSQIVLGKDHVDLSGGHSKLLTLST